jgi:hypothetical protein
MQRSKSHLYSISGTRLENHVEWCLSGAVETSEACLGGDLT